MEDEDRKRRNFVVALAKVAYDTAVTIKDNDNPTIVQIAKQLHWIICHTGKWENICSPDSNDGPTYTGLKHAVEHAHWVLEAASQPREFWRPQVKKVVGSTTTISQAVDKSNKLLDTILKELQVDSSDFTNNEEDATHKSIKEVLESFASAPSNIDSNLTNQQELEQSLATILKETSEVRLADPIPDKMETLKFEVKLDREIEFGEILAEGVFANVHAGTYRKKPFITKQVAIKCIKVDITTLPKKKLLQDAMRIASEAMWANSCSIHPNFVRVYGYHVGWGKSNLMERPMIVMERMQDDRTLFQDLHNDNPNKRPSTFGQRVDWLLGVASALEFLHLQGMVHHDVKSLNVLLLLLLNDSSKTLAKLGDFGITKVQGLNSTPSRLSTILATSTVRTENGTETIPGSIAYRAPELFALNIRGSSRKAEMYAFGVTVWECLTGKIPHEGSNESTIRQAVTHQQRPILQLPEEMMDSLKASSDDREVDAWNRLHYVANCCISRELSKRLTATQVVQVLSQRKFQKVEPLPKEEEISQVEEVATTSPVPVVAAREDGVVPDSQPQSEFYELPRWQPEPTVIEINSKRRYRVVVITMVIIIVVVVFVAPVVAVMGSDAYQIVQNTTIHPTIDPTASPTIADSWTTPSPTFSPVPQDCILSNFQLRRAVEDWFDPAEKGTVEASLGTLANWCFGPAVTDMSNLFEYRTSFNIDLSQWDVSYVTNMKGMFRGAVNFDQNLCDWGDKLEGRLVDLDNIFFFTDCQVEVDPDLNADPPGPFCHQCR